METFGKLQVHRRLAYVVQCHLLIFMEKPGFDLHVCIVVTMLEALYSLSLVFTMTLQSR